MRTGTEPAFEVIDLAQTPLRELNARLHAAAADPDAPRRWRVSNPGGRHAIAVGLSASSTSACTISPGARDIT